MVRSVRSQRQRRDWSQQQQFTESSSKRSAQLPFVPVARTQRINSFPSTFFSSDASASAMQFGSDELSSSANSDGFSPHPPGLVPLSGFRPSSAPLTQPQPQQPLVVSKRPSHQPSSQKLREAVNEAVIAGTVTSLLKGHSHKSLETVQTLRALLEEAGYSLMIDEYNILLHASSQAGDVELSERCMEDLIEKGITPNLISYNSVINACAVSGDTECAVKWLAQLQVAGFQPNDITYGTICKAFSRKGDATSIQCIIDALEEQGYPPNEYYYASLISAWGNQTPANLMMAERAFLNLVEKGLRVQSVKKVLVRVLGQERAVELLQSSAAAAEDADASPSTRAVAVTAATAIASKNAHVSSSKMETVTTTGSETSLQERRSHVWRSRGRRSRTFS
eukprot:TRINITY_DN18043_c0_g1_i1.p1 TRINITY_DN18043_c0_g1~~TRINITY_DN18043_c0_g1_i1.p1  ORF type:complete len:394 (-),score=44.41 TRINITY_DN18043_c0_g1_i1:275-1456(-)